MEVAGRLLPHRAGQDRRSGPGAQLHLRRESARSHVLLGHGQLLHGGHRIRREVSRTHVAPHHAHRAVQVAAHARTIHAQRIVLLRGAQHQVRAGEQGLLQAKRPGKLANARFLCHI